MGCVNSSGSKPPASATKENAADSAKSKDNSVPVAKKDGNAPKSQVAYNHALIFIKPKSMNPKVASLVESFLAEKGIEILSQGHLTGDEIDTRGIIDDHYAHIAKIALKQDPATLPVADEKKAAFASQFGAGEWDDLAKEGRILNMKQFVEKTSMGYDEVETRWRAVPPLKLAPGTYVGKVNDDFILNAFYGAMRQVYTAKEVKVGFYVVRFAEDELNWADFRGKVIGATDPTKAADGSLRQLIMNDYKELDITEVPSTGNNGVHASAGPIEGLRERIVWTGASIEKDPFGIALSDAGVPRALLDSWLANDRVTIKGETDNAYDLLEDINSTEVIEIAKTIATI